MHITTLKKLDNFFNGFFFKFLIQQKGLKIKRFNVFFEVNLQKKYMLTTVHNLLYKMSYLCIYTFSKYYFSKR